MSTEITIPLINPNEPEALLADLHVSEGQQVERGDILCTLETTKSTAELEAERSGYVIALQFEAGQTVKSGDLLCYLADTPDWQPPIEARSIPQQIDRTSPSSSDVIPANLRVTKPALALARQLGLDPANLPVDRLITESLVQSFVENQTIEPAATAPESAFDPTAIIIYGGGGHGKALIELLRALGNYRILGVVDDGISVDETIMGLPVLGGNEILTRLYEQGVRLAVNAVGGIGNIAVRIRVFQRLAEAGFACPAVIHPTAFVEPSAVLSAGSQVFPHAYVGSEAQVGYGCIVNTSATVSHDCVLGEYANIAPGALLAGEVQIGAGALIGMGATINLRARIGAGARIGNGATVKEHVPDKGIVRAGAVWPA